MWDEGEKKVLQWLKLGSLELSAVVPRSRPRRGARRGHAPPPPPPRIGCGRCVTGGAFFRIAVGAGRFGFWESRDRCRESEAGWALGTVPCRGFCMYFVCTSTRQMHPPTQS